jgi:hypothetical protein
MIAQFAVMGAAVLGAAICVHAFPGAKRRD